MILAFGVLLEYKSYSSEGLEACFVIWRYYSKHFVHVPSLQGIKILIQKELLHTSSSVIRMHETLLDVACTIFRVIAQRKRNQPSIIEYAVTAFGAEAFDNTQLR